MHRSTMSSSNANSPPPASPGHQHQPTGPRRPLPQARAVGVLPDVPDFLGRRPALEVGVRALAGRGAANERADAEDRPRRRRAEIEVDVAHVAALQGPPVHDVAAGHRPAGASLVRGRDDDHR